LSPGAWAEPPMGWESTPEERLLSKEALQEVSRAIEALPPNQREVIRLRDVLGWPSSDVRNALDISETNQRVLLHRARAKVRRALESYLRPEKEQGA
jgi:RNA polymerase sigma-70 factor, ECF subfamily